MTECRSKNGRFGIRHSCFFRHSSFAIRHLPALLRVGYAVFDLWLLLPFLGFLSMTAAYRAVLEKVRLAFPQPTSNPVHDSYFVHSILRALDAVDAMKSDLPILGEPEPLDYAAATQARLCELPSSIENVTTELVEYLEGIQVFGHPRWQENVLTQPAIPSLIGVLLSSLY